MSVCMTRREPHKPLRMIVSEEIKWLVERGGKRVERGGKRMQESTKCFHTRQSM